MDNRKKFTEISESEKKSYGVVSLAIRPNLTEQQYGTGGLSGKELQKKFDALANLVIGKYNTMAKAFGEGEAAKYIGLDSDTFGDKSIYDLIKENFDSDTEGNIYIKVRVPASDLDDTTNDTTTSSEDGISLENAIIQLINYKNALHALVTSDSYKESIKGEDGKDGDNGKDGDPGIPGATGNGIKSITRINESKTDGGANEYQIDFTDTNMSPVTFTIYNGSKGSPGRPFSITKYYDTENDRENDTSPIDVGYYCLVRETGNLYVRAEDENGQHRYLFIADMTAGTPVDGIGISEISFDQSTEAGKETPITIHLTNGERTTFYVWNGTNGTNGDDGNGIASISETDKTDEKGNVIGKTITISYTDENKEDDSFIILHGKDGNNGNDGASISFVNQTSPSADGVSTVTFTRSDGKPVEGSIQIKNGKDGKPFQIAKTYTTKELMEADLDNIELGSFLMISSGQAIPPGKEEDAEYVNEGTLWTLTKNENDKYVFKQIAKLLGATGIRGEDGTDGKNGISIKGITASPIKKEINNVETSVEGCELNVISDETDKDGNPLNKSIGTFRIYDGVGIKSVAQTSAPEQDGGTNVITFYLTNGDEKTVYIRNGSSIIFSNDGATGIYYSFAEDNSYAICRGMGLCNEEKIAIAEKANGVPVTIIGDESFDGVDITSVTIPNTIEKIGVSAFDGCEKLTEVIGMNSVKEIGEKAFANCTSLPSITIPNSVKTIGWNAFSRCTDLISIILPGTVTINGIPFLWCESLESIYIEAKEGNRFSTDENGALFENNSDGNPITLIRYPIGDTATDFTVRDGVYTIGTYAFHGAKYLQNVILNQAATLEESAFEGCSKLLKIRIPNTRTDINIPSKAFKDCASMGSIVIPTGVTSISEDAFAGCTSLKKVYYEGTAAEWSALIPNIASGNDAIKSSTIYYFSDDEPMYAGNWWRFNENDEVAEYGELHPWLTYTLNTDGKSYSITDAVIRDDTLANVTINPNHPDGKPIVEIADNAFAGTTVTSVEIGSNIKTIGANAFKECTKLASINIPNNVEVIRDAAFIGCTGITEIKIGTGLSSLGNKVFANCPSITNISILPQNTKYASDNGLSITNKVGLNLIAHYGQADTIPRGTYIIGSYAFSNCTFEKVSLPNVVRDIGEYAFNECKNLTEIEMFDSVKSIGSNAFFGCDNLTTIKYHGDAEEWDLVKKDETNTEKLSAITIEFIIPEPELTFVEKYENDALVGYAVTGILNATSSFDLAIPDTYMDKPVIEIFELAFSGNPYLNSVSIPASVKVINKSAFANCANLSSITFSDECQITKIDRLTFYNCPKLENIKIPDSVKEIGSSAFERCKWLVEVTGGDGVTTIRKRAFKDSGIQKAVHFGNTTHIEDSAFLGCLNLQFVDFQKAYAIGDENHGWAFAHCPNLLSAGLGNSVYEESTVVYVGQGTFLGCSKLSTIFLPTKTKTAWETFSDCKSLTRVVGKGHSLNIINEREFQNCGFTELDIPDTVHTLDIECFQNNANLETVIIPASVERIMSRAFAQCPNMKNVYFKGTKKQWKKMERAEDTGLPDDDKVIKDWTKPAD